MDPLEVDVYVVFDTSRSVSNDAVDLHEQLAGLNRDWDNLSRSWSGTASSAYSPLWEEWLGGATALVDSLDDVARKLAVSAAEYADKDVQSGTSISSVQIERGL